MKRILLVIVSFFCVIQTPCYSQKKVSWLHGLNDKNPALHYWLRYSETLVDEAHQGLLLSYVCDTTNIQQVTQDVREKLLRNNNFNHILVGHSAGGLVARNMLYNPNGQLNPRFKSVITAGTPHFGAGVVTCIADSTRTYVKMVDALEHEVTSVAMSAYDSLTEISELIAEVGVLRGIFGLTVLSEPLLSSLGYFLSVDLPNGLNFIRNYLLDAIHTCMDVYVDPAIDNEVEGFWNQPFVRDMHPESTFIQNLNSRPIPIPIVNIYGITGQWAALKLASSLCNRDSVCSINNTDNDPYETEFIDTMQEIEASVLQYIASIDKYYQILRYVDYLDILGLVDIEEVLPLKTGFEELQEYMMYQFDNEYACYVLDAYHEERRTILVPIYKAKDDFDLDIEIDDEWDNGPIEHLEFQIPEIIGYEEHVAITRVYESHDGLVRQKDAELPTGMGQIIYNMPITDLNHMAMSANNEVEEILVNAFERGAYGDEFVYNH